MTGASDIVLDKLRVGVVVAIADDLLDPSVDVVPDVFSRHVELAIRGFLLGTKIGTHPYRHPADWWQAVKARWLPEWALRRWPVRYTTVDWSVAVAYPDLHKAISLPATDRRATLVSGPWTAVKGLEGGEL